jgi:hypothetical protein
MATLAELFNPTFFLFLGILVLVVALMVLYYESKIRDQNHKIASMLSLVSTLAEDMNNVKFGLNHVAMRHGGTHQQDESPLENKTQNNTIVKNSSHLIDVSDDEDDDESDDESDNESDDEDSQDSQDSQDSDDNESDNDSDDAESVDAESIDNQNDIAYNNIDTRFDYNSDGIIFGNDFNNVKILKLNIFNQDDVNSQQKYEPSSKIEEIDENSFNIESNDDESNEDLEEENLEEINDELSDSISIMSELPNDLEELNSDNANVANKDILVTKTSSGDFKRIAINLGEDQPAEHIDYKKLQLPKLRSLAVEKGLTSNSEASKLKKQDLLKMLESE